MFGGLKALCRLRLHNMKKQLVVFFRKKLGLRNFFTHRGGIFFSGRTPPRGGGGYEKTVIPRIFFALPPCLSVMMVLVLVQYSTIMLIGHPVV